LTALHFELPISKRKGGNAVAVGWLSVNAPDAVGRLDVSTLAVPSSNLAPLPLTANSMRRRMAQVSHLGCHVYGGLAHGGRDAKRK
jgi:hypothetical protein